MGDSIMAGTFLGEVSIAQLSGAAQASVSLTPQATDPAVSATAAQLYAKTDKNLYHEDTSGIITNLLLPASVANSALGPQTIGVGPFVSTNTNSYYPGYGFPSTTTQNVSYVIQQRCSLIGVSAFSGSIASSSGTITILKNNASLGTALTVSSTGTALSYFYATFNNGTYVFNPGDQLNFGYSGSQTALSVAATLNAGSQAVSSIASALTANTTVASTDNQRVWVANASTQYVLTLPATSAAQDFYVRATVIANAGAGVKIQAPSGAVIYNGSSVSSAGGSLTATAIGAYATLYNPANTSVWINIDPSSLWTTA